MSRPPAWRHTFDEVRRQALAAIDFYNLPGDRCSFVDFIVHIHSEVVARYGWGKTKGYQNLKDRERVPPPVMTHPDRWRLDQLLAWEEKRMELAEAPMDALVAPRRGELTVADPLPQPKRRRRSA